MRVLVDTCVIVDALQNGMPFATAAQDIFRLCAKERFIGCITAKASTDIYYLTHRCTHSDKDTRAILTKLFMIFDVLDTAGSDCRKAITSQLSDYEDAVMVETAVRTQMDCIVTRNGRDYANADLPVYSPEQFLQMMTSEA